MRSKNLRSDLKKQHWMKGVERGPGERMEQSFILNKDRLAVIFLTIKHHMNAMHFKHPCGFKRSAMLRDTIEFKRLLSISNNEHGQNFSSMINLYKYPLCAKQSHDSSDLK